MPVYRKKFSALEVANLLTDYDADFSANFLDDIASKIGVSPSSVHDDAANDTTRIGDLDTFPIGVHDAPRQSDCMTKRKLVVSLEDSPGISPGQ